MQSQMRVVLADRDSASRSALALLLNSQADFQLVGEASEVAELLAQIKSQAPDFVILDWDQLGPRIELLLDLLDLFESPPKIVGLSVRPENKEAASIAGLAGFAHKGEPPEQLLQILRNISQASDDAQSHPSKPATELNNS